MKGNMKTQAYDWMILSIFLLQVLNIAYTITKRDLISANDNVNNVSLNNYIRFKLVYLFCENNHVITIIMY